jgi:hypothetical protein
MKTIYTAANAKKLLPFATEVKSVKKCVGCVQVTYKIGERQYSTFLSSKSFQQFEVAEVVCDDHLTQPWVVMVGGKEIFRANTHSRCASYVRWHCRQGTLPAKQRGAVNWNSEGDRWSAIAS